MQSHNNVREAFAPLGMRLHFFEAGLHLLADNEHDLEVNRHDYYYFGMIDKVGREVNRYDSVEVYNLAEEYKDRSIRVLVNFEEQTKANQEVAFEKWKMWNDEIYDYLIELLAIMDSRKGFQKKQSERSNTSVIDGRITLPENFTVSQMQQHFKPKKK